MEPNKRGIVLPNGLNIEDDARLGFFTETGTRDLGAELDTIYKIKSPQYNK